MTNDGKQLQFDALIDPGSYSVGNSGSNDNVSNSNIVSYISESLATKIKDKILEDNTNKCTCTPSKTCTPTGCFTSTSCLTVTGNRSTKSKRLISVYGRNTNVFQNS